MHKIGTVGFNQEVAYTVNIDESSAEINLFVQPFNNDCFVQIGYIFLEEVDPSELMEECFDDWRTFIKRYPRFKNKKWFVPSSRLSFNLFPRAEIQEDLEGFGFGLALYSIAISHIYHEIGDFIMIGDGCIDEGTSEKAQRIYPRLGRIFPQQGLIVGINNFIEMPTDHVFRHRTER